MKTLRFLGLCGSLKAGSLNARLLAAAALLAPPRSRLDVYSGIQRLPHYSPDLDVDPLPAAATDLRAAVRRADGLLICCPEYARGLPGAFKNALDWLVGGDEAYGKWVASLNASPWSTHAQQSLEVVLRTLGMRWHERASIALPLRGRKLDARGIAADPDLGGPLSEALSGFVRDVLAEPG